jgi:hypothetical protein
VDVISAISGVMTAVKGVTGVLKASNDVKVAGAMLDVEMKLIDVRRQVVVLTEENEALKAELAKLKSNKPEVVTRDGLYYSAEDPTDGPFCTACHDQSKKLIRLTDRKGTHFGLLGRWLCNVCKAQFGPQTM